MENDGKIDNDDSGNIVRKGKILSSEDVLPNDKCIF